LHYPGCFCLPHQRATGDAINSPTKNKKRTEVRIDLPDKVLALRPKIKVFQEARKHEKRESEWHRLCLGSPGYERWRQRYLYPKSTFDLEFSGSAARAYSALFDLRSAELPYCTPSRVMEVSGLAGKLIELLPPSDLLPGEAQRPSFRQGLTDLRRWRQNDLPAGISARGDPTRRWMIRKIAEEFYYGFARIPSVGVVGDLIRLGWPEMTDRSIRNTLNETLLSEIVETVDMRRKNENHAIVTATQAIAKASREVGATLKREAVIHQGDAAILAEMERLAAALADDYSRNRLLASVKATRDEAGYPQRESYEGN
jgi:hypothetical protein